MMLKPAGVQAEAHASTRLVAHPAMLRAASFLSAGAILALAATVLVTMKIAWTATDHGPDAPVIDVQRWTEPTPPAQPNVRQPPPAHETQTEPTQTTQTAEPQTQTQTQDGLPVSHDIREPRWEAVPNARDYARFYPPRALDRGIGGRVLLNCFVGADRHLACAVVSETPQAQGFGEAALRIAQSFRIAPQTVDGQPTDGGRVQVPITFRAE